MTGIKIMTCLNKLRNIDIFALTIDWKYTAPKIEIPIVGNVNL